MRVGILGGGMQGCCCALALAERGVDVTLFDRNDQLLSRSAVANEGKIHLGYIYANDPTYSTARMMMEGALSFAPFFARHLGVEADAFSVSFPAVYAVHRDSQRSVDQISQYLETVQNLVAEASDGRPNAYFGRDLSQKPRQWSQSEREAEFDGDIVLAAFETSEIAVNPVALTDAIRARIQCDRRIEVLLTHTVLSVESTDSPVVITKDADGTTRHRFDHVVNALWDGRLAVDETLGLRPNRPWLHRLKYGVSFRLPERATRPPSATFISGPFGEVVAYHDRLVYLTWYPTCLLGISSELVPPEWPTYPDEQEGVPRGTLDALAEFVLSLRELELEDLMDVTVKGGVIVAWGETDIHDPKSELHRRYEIGVTSDRKYHSVDPGKLTMAPYFAQLCTNRIVQSGPR